MNLKIFDLTLQKNKIFLKNVIIPNQRHSNNIIDIKTGKENLENCDGLITSNENYFSLGIKTADCAAITFYDNNNYGIIHAGWRGLVNGIIEKMLDKFTKPKIFVSPLLNEFEITKDYCYDQIKKKFGDNYFYIKKNKSKEMIIFKFQKILELVLPNNTIFDLRNTFENQNLASWRRDFDEKRNYTIVSNSLDF